MSISSFPSTSLFLYSCFSRKKKMFDIPPFPISEQGVFWKVRLQVFSKAGITSHLGIAESREGAVLREDLSSV